MLTYCEFLSGLTANLKTEINKTERLSSALSETGGHAKWNKALKINISVMADVFLTGSVVAIANANG